jgi:hypothetical protein
MIADGNWFSCEGCSGRVEVVPLVERCREGTTITASARVRDAGRGGFSLVELGDLARLWLGLFQMYAEGYTGDRLGRRGQHQRLKMSPVRMVGAWFDPEGVDRSVE